LPGTEAQTDQENKKEEEQSREWANGFSPLGKGGEIRRLRRIA
jgi:hypothetical protein